MPARRRRDVEGGWVSRRVDSSNSKKELGCRDPRLEKELEKEEGAM